MLENKTQKISLRDYHRMAMRTSPRDGHDKIDNGVLGLIGETGELVDLYKKWVYQSTPGTKFPYESAINELGDVLWYLEDLADGIDTTLNMISPLTFLVLDEMTCDVRPLPSIRTIVIGLAKHANCIRRAVDAKCREDIEDQMRRMLNTCAWMARLAGVSMDTVAYRNIEKLKKRYPEGFNAKVSMERSAKEYAE